MEAHRVMHRLRPAIVATAFVLAAARTVTGQPCANPPIPNVSSSTVPTDVCIPTGFAGLPIQFFDDFSWRSFIAMVWPALDGERGVPDATKNVRDAGPRVFETYKVLHELFHVDGSAPTSWTEYDTPGHNVCNVQTAQGTIVLGAFSKFANLGQAGFGTLTGPLVAQNSTFVRYETSFNQSLFEQIVTPQWYLRANLPASLTFLDGSLVIKAAWIDMTGIPNPERYYTRQVWLLDPTSGSCSETVMGLVGLHIVQKTPTRPQWIWTTFEHVDNVPPPHLGAPGSFAFNNGGGDAMPARNPYSLDPLPPSPPAPFNVQRTLPVHSSTAGTNSGYQRMLAGSVWEFYELTMTQWPIPVSSPSSPGTPNLTFPGTGATTAFSNSTLETFEQGDIKTGCMNCHNSTRVKTDFLWSLKDHAFPATTPALLLADPEFRALRRLLAEIPRTEAAKAQIEATSALAKANAAAAAKKARKQPTKGQ